MGTTFKVYLPLVEQPVELPGKKTRAGHVSGSEKILLVEDQELVRNVAKKILTSNGYQVMEASNGGEAYYLFQQQRGQIDLLLTDVVMPNMNGRELVEKIRQTNPRVKVLFMSGYPDDIIAHHDVIRQNERLVQKPFTKAQLLETIREVLEQGDPLDISEGQTLSIHKEPSETLPRPDLEDLGRGRTVLVIDDDTAVQMSVSGLLEMMGFHVKTAGNGSQGINIFKGDCRAIDLVFLDMTLPDMDGNAVFQEIRAIRDDVPVLMSSGYAKDQVVDEKDSFSACTFLHKPFMRKDLRQAVIKVLGEPSAACAEQQSE